MRQETPSPLPIYVLDRPLARLGLGTRAIAAVLSILSISVLIIASTLTPDPRGVETHTQLGLPACGWLVQYGFPCMTCGMTTSFSHAVRGQLIDSLWAQPMGTLLALLTAMAFWTGLYAAVTGRPGVVHVNRFPVTRFVLLLVALGIVGWAYKIAQTLL